MTTTTSSYLYEVLIRFGSTGAIQGASQRDISVTTDESGTVTKQVLAPAAITTSALSTLLTGADAATVVLNAAMAAVLTSAQRTALGLDG